MNITLLRLELISFRRIKNLVIELDGQDAMLSGRNATGKSTVYNALLWLLFGKDSEGKQSDVKPIDEDGQRISGCDTEVKAVLNVDGKPVTLRKVLHEKWQKTAGSVDPIYVADECLCWVDGVPMKIEKEYLPYVLNLVGGDESTFKLVTNSNAFMSLHWNDRRKELMRIAGMDADAVLTDERFSEIPQILNGATTDDARKRLLEQKKRHNDSLKTIPARMDELERSFQPVTEAEALAANAEIERLEGRLAAIDDELASGGEASSQMDRLLAQKRDARAAMERIREKAEREHRAHIRGVDEKLEATRREALRRQNAIAERETLITSMRGRIEEMGSKLEDLRVQRRELVAAEYSPVTQETVCPTCGQELPYERVQLATDRHYQQWCETKEKQVAAITEQGIAAKAKLGQEQTQLVQYEAELASMRTAQENLVVVVAEYEKQLAEAQDAEVEYEDEEFCALRSDFEAASDALEQMGTDDRVSALRAEKAALKREMEAPGAVLMRFQIAGQALKRKEALEAEKRSVGEQLVDVERQLVLLGEYVSARCAAFEDAINSHFKTIRWKLFEENKQGSIHDCCKATVEGINYEESLNTSAKVNAGIEIIRVLSKAYGISVPCFVDNTESINHVADTGGQMIHLKVTGEPTLTLTLMGTKEEMTYGATA